MLKLKALTLSVSKSVIKVAGIYRGMMLNPKQEKGGSRLVLNQSVMETEGMNRRTCLVDAICGIIPVNEVKNSVQRSFYYGNAITGGYIDITCK